MIYDDINEFLKPFNLNIDDVKGQLAHTHKSKNLYIRKCLLHFLHFNKKYSYRQIGIAIELHHSMVAYNISLLPVEEAKRTKDNELSDEQQQRMFNYLKLN